MQRPNQSRYVLLVAGVLAASAHPLGAQIRREFTEVHLGMPVRVVLEARDDATARAAARAAFRRIAELEHTFSDYRADSELRRLEQHAGRWVYVSEPLLDVLQRARDVARLTAGAFDPTAAPVVALWREARKTGVLPDAAAVAAARHGTGWQWLQLDTAQRAVRLARAGMKLDLGGIAKGYILQAALRSLQEHGIDAALIEAGGDIMTGAPPRGQSGWRIETPGAGAAFAARAASLSRAAIATSGATFQHLEANGMRYSHIIDPRTGAAVTHSLTARVIAQDAALADALATALSVDPASAGRLRRHFPGVHIDIAPAALPPASDTIRNRHQPDARVLPAAERRRAAPVR